MMNALDLTLYLVTDSNNLDEETFLAKIALALEGGVTLLQLREKEKSSLDFFNLAIKVKELTQKYNVPLLINDRLDIALAVEAQGVHLGQSDLPISKARQLLGQDKIIGATVKTMEQALRAEAEGADYLGIGAIYLTNTKKEAIVTSVQTLSAISQKVKIPFVAIGGLNKDNLAVLHNSGAKGVAVSSVLMQSTDVCNATKALKKAVEIIKS